MRTQNFSTKCLIEGLEQRNLFSVIGYALSDSGQLNINGTSGVDQISVRLIRPSDDGAVSVEIQSGMRVTKKPLVLKNITGVSVNGRDGNDRILVFGTLDERYSDTKSFFVNINGGAGNDNLTVKNFDGVIGVSAGEGDDNVDLSGAIDQDYVLGPQSYRWVYCGPGNDVARGSFANDDLDGEDGNDVLMGSDGDDYLTGGRGTNTIFGNGGDDTLLLYPKNGLFEDNPYPWHFGGDDTFDGGEGRDSVVVFTNTALSSKRVFSLVAISVEEETGYDYADNGNGKG
jgi:Ca2+-binding RTX toxin-like protein